MDIIFDTATGALRIDAGVPGPFGATLRAVLERHGQVINLIGVQMRLTITADGVQVFELHLPPFGVHYRRTDQDVLAVGRAAWRPGQSIEVAAWCKTRSGREVTAETSFQSPHVPIDINHADIDALQSLDGVGASLAEAIIAGRPWTDPAGISQIGGVSEAMVRGWMAAPGLVAGAVEIQSGGS